MIADYHMHLRNAGEEIAHDTRSVEPFVEAARAAGVDEIGFTEHVYYFRQTRSLWTVPYQTERCVYDLEPYVRAVVEAQDRGLPVKLGLEVDYVPGREEETRELLAPYPWDFLLGSVHYVDGLGVDAEPRLLRSASRRPGDGISSGSRQRHAAACSIRSRIPTSSRSSASVRSSTTDLWRTRLPNRV